MNYRLYIDEVGNDSFTCVANDNHRYLSLTGIMMLQDYVRDVAAPRLEDMKRQIFRNDPDSPVILHRTEIVQKKGIFGKLGDQSLCDQFDHELIRYVAEIDYTVITAVIDKKAMLSRTYWRQNHPYHYLMEILVEKYVLWLERNNATGDIMPEKRGKPDTLLQKAFEEVYRTGTRYVSPERIQVRLPASKLKFRSKPENISGLQICDLIAHPSHMHVRSLKGHTVNLGPFTQQIIPILNATKYDRSRYDGSIIGYGIKYLP